MTITTAALLEQAEAIAEQVRFTEALTTQARQRGLTVGADK